MRRYCSLPNTTKGEDVCVCVCVCVCVRVYVVCVCGVCVCAHYLSLCLDFIPGETAYAIKITNNDHSHYNDLFTTAGINIAAATHHHHHHHHYRHIIHTPTPTSDQIRPPLPPHRPATAPTGCSPALSPPLTFVHV